MTSQRHEDDNALLLVREVAGELEILRKQRQARWHDQRHPQGKRFTQQELVEDVYGAYKNLVLGLTRRIPLRADLLRIADYLECTIHETNDLLAIAQYAPFVTEAREDEERAAVAQALALLHQLPLPAFVVTRGWDILALNHLYIQLVAVPELEGLTPSRRNAVGITLDPRVPFRYRVVPDEQIHQRLLSQHLQRFQRYHAAYRYEPWYRAQLEELAQYREVQGALAAPDTAPSTNQTLWSMPSQQFYTVAPITIPLHTTVPGLALLSAVPVDAAARRVFQQIGCGTSENRWEQALP